MRPFCKLKFIPRINLRRFILFSITFILIFLIFRNRDRTQWLEDNGPLIRIGRSLQEGILFSENRIIDTIDLPCNGVFNGDNEIIDQLKNYTFDDRPFMDKILQSTDRCNLYRSLFGFSKSSSSHTEIEFPLAFGVLAHNRFVQLLFMLSSFFESQNLFCITVPSSSDHDFIRLVHGLPDCFDNFYVMQTGPISWGSYNIMKSTYDCMEYLDKRKDHKWKYFQYLSGVDVPLRTNMEMVKIFKEWNGLSHILVAPFQKKRLGKQFNKTSPMKLFKTSLSGVISREAAHVMVTHKKAKELIQFLKPTLISDESFWASALGNPDVLPIPGSFNATLFYSFVPRYLEMKRKKKGVTPPPCVHPPCLSRGFIGRYQIWYKKSGCKGKMTHASCVYGIADLPKLIDNAALVAHKLYIEYESAAFMCMIKELDHRRQFPDELFNSNQYNHLPQIEFLRGHSYENLSRYDLIL